MSLVTSLDKELEVRAVMTPGCVAEMEVTVLGRDRAALAPTWEQEEKSMQVPPRSVSLRLYQV